MAKEDFVPVAGDDWYERRRDDAEGRFFRSVADLGPRKGEGGSTRQGIYCLTADGKLLFYQNAQDPVVMRQALRRGLQEWARLPEGRRRPGAIQVGEAGNADERYHRTLPLGGLVVNVYTRILDKNSKSDLCRGTCPTSGGEHAAHDHLWLTAEDVHALVPEKAKKGDRFPLPAALAERILRFHLVDNTRGEPPAWQLDQIRRHELMLTVQAANADGIWLRLDGFALLATDADIEKSKRGFDVRLLGFLHYDAAEKALARFDVLVVGEHWGEGPYTRAARLGRTPLGVVFELARGETPADRVPPQGARTLTDYLGTDH